MDNYRNEWRKRIYDLVCGLMQEKGTADDSFTIDNVVIETPPQPELGDIAFPLFPFAKLLKLAPAAIGEKMLHLLKDTHDTASIVGPYLNIKLKREAIVGRVLSAILSDRQAWGQNQSLKGKRIMVEFSCPNTNKPLHLGHLRNDALGESIAKIIKKCGAQVLKVNLINDRGIHICKSMLAYQKFGAAQTPEAAGKKSDHFVGDYYVKFAEWAKNEPGAENETRALLKAWEEGDPEVRALWKLMNQWAIEGIKQTYEATGVSFDKYYFESETYELGKDQVLAGLAQGIFIKKEDNSIWVDLSSHNLDDKVLLRGDGTSLYLTQDLGTAVMRAFDWPFDKLVYIAASEQNYHFTVLFLVLSMLGFPWAKQLYHLSYGMVHLPEGRMKSREGTVVDADDLLAELTGYAVEEIKTREREEEIDDMTATARQIALAALNYYLLAATPHKDIIFNPKESLSFNGNTGPYLQYTGARLASILRKFNERRERFRNGRFKPELLTVAEEWELVKRFADFSAIVARAAEQMDPSLITASLYDCCKLFASYYHDHQVLGNDDPDLVLTRIELVRAFLYVLKSGFELIDIPFLDKM